MKSCRSLLRFSLALIPTIFLCTEHAAGAPLTTVNGTPSAPLAPQAVDTFELSFVSSSFVGTYPVKYNNSNAKLGLASLGNNVITVRVDPNQSPGAAATPNWTLTLRGPGSNKLNQANYAPAENAAVPSALPGIKFSPDNVDCFPEPTSTQGSFEIKRISRAATKKLKVDFQTDSCSGSYKGFLIINTPADVTSVTGPTSIVGSSNYSSYYAASNLLTGGLWIGAYGQRTAYLDVQLPGLMRLKDVTAQYYFSNYYATKITSIEGYVNNSIVAVASPGSCAHCAIPTTETIALSERVNRLRIYFSVAGTNSAFIVVQRLTIKTETDFANWQNQENSLDVNSDGYISPIDALQIINSLNTEGARRVGVYHPYTYGLLDVTGDNIVNSTDALTVINYLNGR